jgi:hypothetical protein
MYTGRAIWIKSEHVNCEDVGCLGFYLSIPNNKVRSVTLRFRPTHFTSSVSHQSFVASIGSRV